MAARMSTQNPVIKFSPFEALLIGEKNKIAKRKPMKNTIFVTCLSKRKKSYDLRDLFDVKEETTSEDDVFKKPERVTDFLKNRKKLRHVKNGNKVKCKTKPNGNVHCYEYEGHKVIVKDRELVKVRRRNKMIQSNKVRFKPDFKFKETLEERIVHKIQKRKKKLKTKLVGNGMLSHIDFKANRHCLRGKDGKFIRKEEYEKMVTNVNMKAKYLSNYLKHLYAKKGMDVETGMESMNGFKEQFEESVTIDDIIGLPKITALDGSETILDNISKQYYENLISKELEFPPLPDLEVSDFDNDSSLLDILHENQPKSVRPVGKEIDDFGDALENVETVRRRRGLRMYERKKSSMKSCNGNGIREIFSNSMKENHCINKGFNVNKLVNLNENHMVLKGRRNGMNYLIDEPPTKDNHLITKNKFRSLFYKTACGSETYLGKIIKPVLLNSSFGRLPDIS